jgi:hypothetical protein
MAETWVKIYRKSIENGWLTNHKLWVFWCYCLLKASRFEHMQIVGNQQVSLRPGEFVFGRKVASKETGMSEQSIRTCVHSLRRMKNITIKSTNKFSIITVINWESYQSKEKSSTNKSTSDQPASNQQVTTNKKEERKKEDKKKDITVFCDYAIEKINLPITNKSQAEQLLKVYKLEGMKQAIDRGFLYWSRERHKRKFRYKKRWSKFYENINVFLSDQDLKERIQEEIRWEEQEKRKLPAKIIEVSKATHTIKQFLKAGRYKGDFIDYDTIESKDVAYHYNNGKIFKVPEDKI